MAILKKQDIIEQGIEKGFDPILNKLNALNDAQLKLIVSSKELQQAYNSINKTNDGSEAKKLVDVNNQLITANKKLISIEHDQLVELQKVKLQIAEKNKLAKEEAQISIGVKGEYDKLVKTLNNLRNSYKNDLIEGKKSTSELKSRQKEIQKLDAQIKRLDASVGQHQRNVGNYRNTLVGLGRQIIGAAGIVGGVQLMVSAFKSAIKVFVDFDKNSSKLAAILGKNKKEIKALTDQAKQLGATTAYTASQVLQADTELAKLGFTTQQIEQSIPGVLSLAAATGTDLAPAAELAAATLRIFNMDASEMGKVSDILAKSTTISSLSMEKLATIMPTVGKTAQLAGVSLERTAALAGTLTDRGLDASTAATSLRNIFLELAAKGLTWDQAMQKINMSTDKNKAALDLFGKRAAAAGSILSETAISTNDLTKQLLNAEGAAKDMADTMLDNLAGDMTIAKSAWEGFILSLEDGQGVFSTLLRKATQFGTGILNMLTALNTEYANSEIKAQAMNKAASDTIPLWETQIKTLEVLLPWLKKAREETERIANLRANKVKKSIKDENAELRNLLHSTKVLNAEQIGQIRDYLEILNIKKANNEATRNEIIYIDLARKKIKEYEMAQSDLNYTKKKSNKEDKEYLEYLKKRAELKDENLEPITSVEATPEAISALDLNEFLINEDKVRLQEEYEQGLLSNEAYQQKLLELEVKYAEDKISKLSEMNDAALKNQSDKELEKLKEVENAKLAIKETFQKEAQDYALIAANDIVDAELAKKQSQAESEKEILKNKLDKGLITEEQYNKQVADINKKYAIEEAKAEKKKALYEIAINTAVAVVKALPNLIKSAAIVAIGGIQAAFVAARPLPKYEKGKINIKGKSHKEGGILAEIEGGESIITKKGTKKAPNTLDLINKGMLSDKDVIYKQTKKSNSDLLLKSLLGTNKRMLTVLENSVYQYENNGVKYIIFGDGSRTIRANG